jgi:hypothetical protein
MIINLGLAVIAAFGAFAGAAMGSTAQAQQPAAGQYVICPTSGCRAVNKYPGQCRGGRKCPGPDERYIFDARGRGTLVKR